MKRKNNKGFTLIELLAVIVILGIILTIVVSNVVKYINDARKGSYVDAYHIIIKDLRTQLLASEINGNPTLTICNDGGSPTCASIEEYKGLYDSNNISMAISGSTSAGFTIEIKPKDGGSFKSVSMTLADSPDNTALSASTSGKDKGNILTTLMSSDGETSKPSSIANEVTTTTASAAH